MTRGTPDWGGLRQRSLVHGGADIGEQAARLNVTFVQDRRGAVLFWDAFNYSTHGWPTYISGAGSSVATTTASTHSGERSLRLTAGSDVSRAARITRVFHPETTGIIGVSIWFQAQTEFEQLYLFPHLYTGTKRHNFPLMLDRTNNTLTYRDAEGDLVTVISGDKLRIGSADWHFLKLVVDAENAEYVRAALDFTEVSLDGIASAFVDDSTSPRIELVIHLTGRAGENDIVDIDDFVLTGEE